VICVESDLGSRASHQYFENITISIETQTGFYKYISNRSWDSCSNPISQSHPIPSIHPPFPANPQSATTLHDPDPNLPINISITTITTYSKQFLRELTPSPYLYRIADYLFSRNNLPCDQPNQDLAPLLVPLAPRTLTLFIPFKRNRPCSCSYSYFHTSSWHPR
jgi:hypothetical protein